MLAVATCNYPAGVPGCNGGSRVFDGVVYVPELDHSRDTCLLQADEKEGVYLAELDLDQLRAYRQREVHGNAYRRPKFYNALIREEVQPPFIRVNRR